MSKEVLLPLQGQKPSYKRTNRRRLIQSLSLALYFIFPFFGIFYFNLDSGSFVLLGKNMGMNNSFIFMLGFFALLFGVICMAVVSGRSFCGWLCPQNFLSEMLNKVINKFALKANGRKKFIPYLLITLSAAFISLAVAINFLFYFGKPSEVWQKLISGAIDPTVAVFSLFFGLLVFAGLGIFRHEFCKQACPYGIMQAAIIDNTTMQVRFAKERSHECINCNACTEVCYMGIEPRMLNQADPGCMNCGLCVEACENVLEPIGYRSMLNFFAEFRSGETLNSKALLIMPAAFFSIALSFLYLFWTLPVADLTLSRNESAVSVVSGDTVSGKYFINLVNQKDEKNPLLLKVENLPENTYSLSEKTVELAVGEKKQLEMEIKLSKKDFAPGVHQFDLLLLNQDQQVINQARGSLFIP